MTVILDHLAGLRPGESTRVEIASVVRCFAGADDWGRWCEFLAWCAENDLHVSGDFRQGARSIGSAATAKVWR